MAYGYQPPNYGQFGQYQTYQQYQPRPYGVPMQAYGAPVKVHGDEGAAAYQIPPNCEAVVFDDSDPFFWFIQTDAAGYATRRKLRYEDVVPEQQPQADYVTHDEIEGIMSRLDGLDALAARVESLTEVMGNAGKPVQQHIPNV